MARKRKGLPVDGILLLNKPYGLSSNKALQQVKFLYKAQKAGHTGSLDPLATGMLPICFGEATKVCAHLLDSNKAYRAEVTLGIKTSTEDGEGEITHQQSVPDFTSAEIEAVLQQFRGPISQIPPMHSAIWHNGKRLYELARAGEVVDVKARNVIIHHLVAEGDIEDNKLILDIRCSKGTYIRSLARDIGEALACGAYMSALHRTYVEPFENESLIEHESLQNLSQENLESLLLPVDTALQHYRVIVLDDLQTEGIFQGRKIVLDTDQQAQFAFKEEGEICRIYRQKSDSASFLGLANRESAHVISPKRLMHLGK